MTMADNVLPLLIKGIQAVTLDASVACIGGACEAANVREVLRYTLVTRYIMETHARGAIRMFERLGADASTWADKELKRIVPGAGNQGLHGPSQDRRVIAPSCGRLEQGGPIRKALELLSQVCRRLVVVSLQLIEIGVADHACQFQHRQFRRQPRDGLMPRVVKGQALNHGVLLRLAKQRV